MSNLVNASGRSVQSQASSSQSDLFTDCQFPYIQGNPALRMNFQRPLRQRCISGPCDGGYGIDQYFQSIYWNNFPTFSPFFSDSDITEQTHPDHMNFVNVDPRVNGTCQSSHAPPIFIQNGHLSKHSTNRFSELLSDYGMAPNQQQRGDQVGTHSRVPNRKVVQHSGFRGRGRNCRGKWDRGKQRSCNHSRQVDSAVKVIDEQSQDQVWMLDYSADAEPFQPSAFSDNQVTEETGLSWQNLPTELWFGIIRYLPYSDRAALARTCRRLSIIVADSSNWRTIRLERHHGLSDAALANIGLKKPQHLHFVYCSGESVTEEGVDTLFLTCGKRLESLSFVGCYKGAFQADYPLIASSRQCPNLRYIDASYNQSVCDQTVSVISRGSRALKSLLLNGAQLISNLAIEYVVRRHKTTLERLELFGCFHLNSRIFKTLGECRGLRALAFGFLHHLSAEGLLGLFSKLPRLASLDLRGTQKLVTDATLSHLAKECPLLEEVVLANSTSLTGEEGVIKMLHQLPRLRVLDLCGLVVVGDDTVRALATSCPLLEELDISATSVTEVGLKYLSEAPTTSLKSLRINHKPDITKEDIETLVKSCPKLTRLSLYGFNWIQSWDFIFTHRPNLVICTETERFTCPSK
ncbi:hypothetical protein Aperf_G00000037372 [Anoplocephala perfoliata]